MSTPPIPQRPARSQQSQPATAASGTTEALEGDGPKIPPRPINRHVNRSISRDREGYSRSPLNEPSFAFRPPSRDSYKESYYSNGQTELPSKIERPPSVASLPMVGQEGMEYASLEQQQDHQSALNAEKIAAAASGQAGTVATDLPLHAPKASAPALTAQTKIAGVTRIDSGPGTPTSGGHHYRSPSGGLQRPPSASYKRSSVSYDSDHDHGIPEIGLRVGLNPQAGDVQAPSFPGSQQRSTSRPVTSDGRRKSAQGFYGPPGSYGLHGHGVGPHDSFERAWYQRHPEELAKDEYGAHTPALASERPEWAMTSDELNKLVHASSNNKEGMGINRNMIGTPDEFAGYTASEQYSLRTRATVKAGAAAEETSIAPDDHSKPEPTIIADAPSTSEAAAGESSIRKPSLSEDLLSPEAAGAKYHVKPQETRVSKYEGAGYDPPTVDLGPRGGNSEEKGGYIHERGDGTPILASDEIARYPAKDWRQAAVSPAQQKHHHDEEYYSGNESDVPYRTSYRSGSRSRSRPSSRPTSVHDHHGHTLTRYTSHELFEGTGTPLEAVEEYEPLFKDEEGDAPKRPVTAADKLRRPELERHRFPSQDIWEDTPSSLQYTAEVETPEDSPAPAASAVFEAPEREQARKGEIIESERSAYAEQALPGVAKAKPKFSSGVQQELGSHSRPGMKQRFPSQDIWEDSPDSLQYTTTIDDEADQVKEVPPAFSPDANKLAQGFAAADSSLAAPTIPSRPARSTAADRKAPVIPDRPKPQIPQRPARSLAIEGSSDKPKPVVPSRPEGSAKFSSIKAGFMNDLNSRLRLGPQAPPKPQSTAESEASEEEKAPLADARKSRARGPMRRKPATGSETDTQPPVSSKLKFSFSVPHSVWSVSDSDSVTLHERPRNWAGTKLETVQEAPMGATNVLAHAPDPEADAKARAAEESAKASVAATEAAHIGFPGDVPEPVPEDQLDTHLPAAKTVAATSREVEDAAAQTGGDGAAAARKEPGEGNVVIEES